MENKTGNGKVYKIISLVILVILAILFLFPLYWIVTGAFKPAADIYAQKPVWWPSEWVMTNFENLMKKRTAPLWQIGLPFSKHFSSNGEGVVLSLGPTVPAVFRWLLNTIFMAVSALLLTCLTA
ncbi:MAG: carbohydrate ABC transporter permease, partial [Lachnospiraceae bacterium]|nr:carbohydrate ABC transporter permease [Lachnospiraceae bacterium]